MSNPVTEVVKEAAATPKTIVSWAKAKPFVFVVMLLAVVLLVIRFRNQIAKFFVGLPVVGKVFSKVMGVGAAAAVFLVFDGGKAQAAVDAASLSPPGHAGLWAMVMLYAVTLSLLLLRFMRSRKGVR